MTPQGKFLARVTGKTRGNVVLRKQQYESSNDDTIALEIAKSCILGKVHNARWVLERAIADHAMQIDAERVKKGVSAAEKILLRWFGAVHQRTNCRGYEGEAASIYFGVFDGLILQQKKDFMFQGRNSNTAYGQDECDAVHFVRDIADQYGDVCTGKCRAGYPVSVTFIQNGPAQFSSALEYDGRTQGSSGRSVCVVVSE